MTQKEVDKAAAPLIAKAEAEAASIDDEKLWKQLMKPRTYDEIENDPVTVDWYEQDLDAGTPRQLIRRGDDPEERKKEIDMHNMIIQAETNPNYDDAELNRRLIDDLLENPKFAALTQQLKDLKGNIRTKEEQEAYDEEMARRAEEQMPEDLKRVAQNAILELINDPAAAVAKDDLQEMLNKMPEVQDVDSPEFLDMLVKATSKLNDDPTFQKKLATALPQQEKELEDLQRSIAEELNVAPSNEHKIGEPIEPDQIDDLMLEMRNVLKSMGGDPKLEAEMDAMMASRSDPMADADGEGVYEREMTPEEMAAEFTKLAAQKAPKNGENPALEEEEEEVPAELQAKVDKIMGDPKLMEKLAYIQNLIEETERAKSDITSIAHEVAPDPYELEDDRTATLKQRMQVARQDPEHAAALEHLRVNLLPPFNISPALKSFNQAIELAYIGANDDIRRILWRSYQKARTLPTFLQNVSDEAWDILYYSQAVTWGSNQNRTDHLRTLLEDLRSLGREGPPTHPSSLVKNGDGEHLEA
jgi:hypothetical protein